MVKCEVLADKCSLVVCKGSIVYVDELQYELARHLMKPVDKAESEEEIAEEKPKRTRKSKK